MDCRVSCPWPIEKIFYLLENYLEILACCQVSDRCPLGYLLFSVKKCQVSTIKGYRSTISNTLKYKTGYDFWSHPVLSELIKSFAIQRPVDRSLAPKWDLAFVLSHMCKAPFEPLDKASLFYLSVKTVFLVTLAMARRVSEVHALSIDYDHLRFSNLDGSLILRTQLGFLAKNQLPSRAPDSIKIPK